VQVPSEQTGKLNLSMHLYQTIADCGDLSDDATEVNEQTRSNRLSAATTSSDDSSMRSLESMGPAHSGDPNVGSAAIVCAASETYCDGTTESGRQLDLCGVCGGNCLPPSCFIQSCPEVSPTYIRIRYSWVYLVSHGST
jgi:hypothetical protein